MSGAVVCIETLDLRMAPFDWAFARDRRAEIDAHFEAQREQKPGLWNGRVLLMHGHEIDGACLRGVYFETDFASFLAWRDFGFPGEAVANCFALAALQGADDAYLLGVMSAGTMNAGRIYFPGGTPDPDDVFGDRVDLEASVRRELREETGLDPDDLGVDPGWHCVPTGPLIALLKPMRARQSGAELRRRILASLSRESDPELSDIRIARGAADIDPMMPDFVRTFLRHRFA